MVNKYFMSHLKNFVITGYYSTIYQPTYWNWNYNTLFLVHYSKSSSLLKPHTSHHHVKPHQSPDLTNCPTPRYPFCHYSDAYWAIRFVSLYLPGFHHAPDSTTDAWTNNLSKFPSLALPTRPQNLPYPTKIDCATILAIFLSYLAS